MRRFLIIFGLMILIIGIIYPYLQNLGLGKIIGDFSFERDGFKFYFPLTSSIIASCIINLIMWFCEEV